MAILKNVEIFFCKLDPARPNDRFDKENPTWETQIRTRDKKQAKEWKDMNINVKTDDDDQGIFYKATLKNETDPKIAAEWIQKAAKKSGTVAAQYEIVSAIVLDPEIEKRDLESALLIADSLAGKNPTIGLQAKAMVFAAKKDWPQAIDLQTDAWMGATIAEKPMAKQRLEEYREASKRAPVKSK